MPLHCTSHYDHVYVVLVISVNGRHSQTWPILIYLCYSYFIYLFIFIIIIITFCRSGDPKFPYDYLANISHSHKPINIGFK